MKSFSAGIRRLDMFGARWNLLHKDKTEFKSQFGGAITLMIWILIFLKILCAFINQIGNNSFEQNYSQRYSLSPESIILTNQTFNFAISVSQQNSKSTIYDPDSFSLYLNQNSDSYSDPSDLLKNEIALTQCNESNFSILDTQQFFNDLSNLHKLYCLPIPSQNLYIAGGQNDDIFQYISIELRVRESKNMDLTGLQKIKEQMQGLVLTLYLTDQIIEAKSSQPLKTIPKAVQWIISPTLPKQAQVFFGNQYVTQDHGFFLPQEKNFKGITQTLSQEQVIPDEAGCVVKVVLQFDRFKEQVYKISFKTFDQILAEIGGISKALFFIGFFLCNPFNRLKLSESVANEVFYFPKDESLKPNNKIETTKLAQQKLLNLKNNPPNNFLSAPLPFNTSQASSLQTSQGKLRSFFNSSQSSNLKDYRKNSQDNSGYHDQDAKVSSQTLSEKQELFSSNCSTKNGQLKLDWVSSIMYYISPTKKAKELRQQVKKSIKSINSHIDVLQIVRMQLEFEKIKHLLLNQDQISLLQFLPKPPIYTGNDSKHIGKQEFGIQRIFQQFKKLIWNKGPKIEKLKSSQVLTEIKEQGQDDNLQVSQSQDQKPNFTQKEKVKQIDYLSKKNKEDIPKEAFTAFKNICSKKKLSKVDEKLIMMLDQKLVTSLFANSEITEKEEEEGLSQQKTQNEGKISESKEVSEIPENEEKEIDPDDQRIQKIYSNLILNNSRIGKDNKQNNISKELENFKLEIPNAHNQSHSSERDSFQPKIHIYSNKLKHLDYQSCQSDSQSMISVKNFEESEIQPMNEMGETDGQSNSAQKYIQSFKVFQHQS